MLQSLVALSVRNVGVVLACAAAVVVAAATVLARLPVDVFPDLDETRVTVLTESPGFTADEVERLVTLPVERALLGARGVQRVRSTSVAGLSLVWVDHEAGVGVDRARQRVGERLTTVVEDLPEDVVPTLAPDASLTGEILQVVLTSEPGGPDALDLRAWAEFDLRPRLLAVPGVAQVSVLGGLLPELTVVARQDALRSFALSLEDVAAAARDAHSTIAAGYLPDDAGRELRVRQSARVVEASDLDGAVVRAEGPRPVLLHEVAEVRTMGALRRGSAARADAESGVRPAVVLGVTKAPGTNTLDVTRAVDDALAGAPTPTGVRIDPRFARHASFISRAVDGVKTVLREAAVVVAVVLLLFLLNVRTAAIALTAIPLALGATVLWLRATGGGIDVMTLGGMAIAVGVLVDDAIIDVENVLRRLRANAARPEGERGSTEDVVVAATAEIRPAMVQATTILALSFVPLFFLEGLEGRFFRPLGVSFVVALVASLAVALTVTPALCRLLLGRTRPTDGEGHGRVARALHALYVPSLAVALRLRHLVVVAALALVVVSALAAARFGTSFLPRFHEGMLTVFVFAPPGTSLDESEDLGDSVATAVACVDGVEAVARRTGRAERDEHAEPVWNSELEVRLDTEADLDATRARVQAALRAFPGVTTSVGQPIEHRLSHVLSGTASDVAVELYHEDPDVLAATTARAALALGDVPGAIEVDAQRTLTVEGLAVEWDRAALARVGLRTAEAAAQLRAAVDGLHVGELVEGLARIDLVVRLAEGDRRSVGDVGALELVTLRGGRVRVSEVASLEVEDQPVMRLRQAGRRKALVACNVAPGSNLGDVVDAARERLGPIAAADGVELRFGGQHEAAARGRRTLAGTSLIVALVGALLLRTTVRTWRAALVVALNLPLALVGAVAALLATAPDPLANALALVRGDPSFVAPVVSLSTLVGVATLFGIALRNGVLLAGRWETLIAEGVPAAEAIRRGARERLLPILMTALTAALGLLPVALAGSEPGTELLAPLAVVVLGGLVSATFLNLVVLPAAYALVRGAR